MVTNAAGKQSNITFATNIILSNRLVSGARLSGITATASTQTPASSLAYGYTGTRVTSQTNAHGFVETYGYDTLNRRNLTTRAVGTPVQRVETTSWHPALDLPTQSVMPGLTVTYSYDSIGRLLTRTETDTTTHSNPYPTAGQTRTWAYAWTAMGKLQSVNGPKAPNGFGQDDLITSAYDAQNNLISETNGLGQVTTYTNHDANGRPGRMVSPTGTVTEFTYDAIGRVTTRTIKHPTDPAQDAVTSFTYDLAGQLVSIAAPDTASLTFQYSSVGRLIAVVDGTGARIDYGHDVLGNISEEKITAPNGAIRQQIMRTYDDLGRLVSETLGAGRTHSWQYDLNDNPIRSVSARNNATQFAFDALDRLVADTDPLNKAATTGFNGQDDPITRTDRRGAQTSSVRNGFGDIIQETSPDRGTWVYHYDAAGDLVQSIDGRGQQIDFDRDILGRVVAKRPAGLPAQNVTYTWDTAHIGRLASITDNSGNTSFSYDHRGNVTGKQVSIAGSFTGTVGYAYDRADRIIRIVYPSDRIVHYNRNTLGQVLASGFAYEPMGPLKSFTYGNGLSLVQDWGNDRRLYAKSVKRADGSDVWAKAYSYDNDDNIIAIRRPHRGSLLRHADCLSSAT